MAAILLTAVSCTPSKGRLQELAEESLRQSVYSPARLKVLAVSEPDSAFGTGYFTRAEIGGMMRIMKAVTDTIMARTAGMSTFDPGDRYTISLADRQMKATSYLRDILFMADRRGDFSGWKVRIDYEADGHDGRRYHSERWTFIDKDGDNVLRTFDIPMP